MPSFAKTKLGLFLLSTILGAVLFVGAYEVARNVHYQLWKVGFDAKGWLGKVMVPSPNPVLMWEYRPYGENEGVKTNRYGFRDLDYESTAKPDDTLRIAFAGDSVTVGLGVRLEDTFVRQFEIEANRVEAEYRVQALNFAVDGYDALQIVEMVRTKVLNFSPDKVVYVMCLNDFDFSSSERVQYFRRPTSFFLLAMERTYRKLTRTEFHEFYFGKNRDVVFQSVLEMRDMLAGEGVDFQVVILPVFRKAPFEKYRIRGMHSEIGVFLDEEGIESFDLYEAFAESGELPRYYASDVWHPNSIGHRLIAQQLLPAVLPDLASPIIEEDMAEELVALGYAEWAQGADAGDLQKAGVTHHDPEKTVPGINLFKSREEHRAQLMDMDGSILHQWVAPERHVRIEEGSAESEYGWQEIGVLPNGDLVGLDKTHFLERIDWNSKLLWRSDLRAHHDLDIDSEGRIFTLAERQDTLGLRDGTLIPILDNEIVILDASDGRILERISLKPYLASLISPKRIEAIRKIKARDPAIPVSEKQRKNDFDRQDVFHTNTIEIIRRDMPGLARAGNVMLSIRELNLVAIFDLDQKRIVWSWGPGELLRQHHPVVLPNGNVMIFDNRRYEEFSRIIELDPLQKKIVWEYRGDPPSSFHSDTRGSSYPMPNGNVLIAESQRGRAFEVTRSGEIVWEYLNPEIKMKGKKRATFYRFNRLPIDYFEPGLLELDPRSN